MSRKSRSEYIGEKRRVYATAKPEKRGRILDEVCETLGYGRKYVNKLLTGNVRYRERKGRGKTYGDDVLSAARTLWEAVGCPCTTYFVLELPRIVREYEECVALIKPSEVGPALLKLSASTLDKAFRGLMRVKPFFQKSNRRSGPNRPLLAAIECRSGEEVMACGIEPRFPFPVTSEHADNGPESINYAMAEMQGRRRRVALSRPRPFRKSA